MNRWKTREDRTLMASIEAQRELKYIHTPRRFGWE